MSITNSYHDTVLAVRNLLRDLDPRYSGTSIISLEQEGEQVITIQHRIYQDDGEELKLEASGSTIEEAYLSIVNSYNLNTAK
jgi:hypothetical protein